MESATALAKPTPVFLPIFPKFPTLIFGQKTLTDFTIGITINLFVDQKKMANFCARAAAAVLQPARQI